MNKKPRRYQARAVESVPRYFKTHKGNPVIAMPTGTGKSLIIAWLLKYVMQYKNQRVLILTHVKELIEQNYAETLGVLPYLDAGIYSSGLKRKDAHSDVVFAGIASVHKRALELGKFDLVLIDECHLVSDSSDTMYQKFITELKGINPRLKVVGLSATPWRLKSGMLTDGNLFTDVCFDNTGMAAYNKLVEQGYLAPLIAQETNTFFDVADVGLRGGEFIPGQLQKAVDHTDLTKRAIAEIVLKARGRKHWLLFAAGVEHCENVVSALTEQGIKATCVHSKLKDTERDKRIDLFKTGKVKAIVNNNILTTGFNFPGIDLIGMLRPTMSPGLWVQMLGRGTRVLEGKTNCLVLDFAGNTNRLGQINNIVLPQWGRKRKGRKGNAPVKTCPKCSTINHARATKCILCGEVFPKQFILSRTSAGVAVVASGKPEIKKLKVTKVTYRKHAKKNKTPSMRVTYYCGLTSFKEWVCFEHYGYARKKAVAWWEARSDKPFPDSVDSALIACSEIKKPAFIDVDITPKYPDIVGASFVSNKKATKKE